jgi:hypothetical protein
VAPTIIRGKEMTEYDYSYTIKNSSNSNLTIGNVTSTYYPYSTWYPNTSYWTYPSTVYMYQIFCPKPRCKGVFWGAIGSVVACPKCSSRVKINNEPPADYEVEVTK